MVCLNSLLYSLPKYTFFFFNFFFIGVEPIIDSEFDDDDTKINFSSKQIQYEFITYMKTLIKA